MARPLVLNAGCGIDPRGDVRLDMSRAGKPHVQGLADALPFKAGTFDRVLMMNVLEHTPNPGVMLQEAARVLRRGGEVHAKTDNAACLWYHVRPPLRFVEGHEYFGEPGDHHYMLFKAHHLRDLAARVGLAEARVEYTEADTSRGLAARLLRWLRPELVAQNVELRARKA